MTEIPSGQKPVKPKKKRKPFKRKPFPRVGPLVDAMGNPRPKGGTIDKRFDDNVIDIIEKALSLGLTYTIAAGNAGIDPQTLKRWMAEGSIAKEGTRARTLWEKATKARNGAAARHIMVINRCSWKKDDLSASKLWLAKNTEEYRDEVRIAGIQDAPAIQLDIKTRGPALKASLKAILKKNPNLIS